jgi:hypothetical protein
MENVIDAVLAEAATQAPEVPKESVNEQTQTEDISQDQVDGSPKDGAEDDDSVTFPKKAINALSRRDRTIGKLRAQSYEKDSRIAALEAQIAQYSNSAATTSKQPHVSQNAPKEEDFDNYGDYLKASIRHDLAQEQASKAQEQKSVESDAKIQEWVAMRETEIAQSMDTHKTAIPDFEQVVAAHVDIADEFPPAIAQAFYEADDPALAFYNLAKEGKLEQLSTMSPYRAAMEIAKAQSKKPVVNKVSSAPDPIKAPVGVGRQSKSLWDSSGDEIIKKLNIR